MDLGGDSPDGFLGGPIVLEDLPVEPALGGDVEGILRGVDGVTVGEQAGRMLGLEPGAQIDGQDGQGAEAGELLGPEGPLAFEQGALGGDGPVAAPLLVHEVGQPVLDGGFLDHPAVGPLGFPLGAQTRTLRVDELEAGGIGVDHDASDVVDHPGAQIGPVDVEGAHHLHGLGVGDVDLPEHRDAGAVVGGLPAPDLGRHPGRDLPVAGARHDHGGVAGQQQLLGPALVEAQRAGQLGAVT